MTTYSAMVEAVFQSRLFQLFRIYVLPNNYFSINFLYLFPHTQIMDEYRESVTERVVQALKFNFEDRKFVVVGWFGVPSAS